MYLVQQMIEREAKKPGARNHVWIYDRSQSMTWTLPRLGDDMIKMSNTLKGGDTLTLAWFSGQGYFRTILKGASLVGDDEALARIILDNIHPVNLTCFSEVLQDTVQSILELKSLYPDNTFSLFFLTDGHPVVSDYRKEHAAIFKALGQLESLVGTATFIGYGSYYNHPLMSDMATAIGGTLVHADDLVQVSHALEVVIESEAANKVTIKVGEGVRLVFGKDAGKITIYPVSDGHAMVSNAEKSVYKAVDGAGEGVGDDSSLLASAYALAVVGDVAGAIDAMAKVGDKYLLDKLFNAYTNDEVGGAVQAIHDAAMDESKRFLDGKKKNYVPRPDAFCLLDALEILNDDREAFFYPAHPSFKYRRIGVGSKVVEGYPAFERDPGARCSFDPWGLTWHKSRLNLSVRMRVAGKVRIFEDGVGGSLGLTPVIDTFVWRNYALVKDGLLNVRHLPVSLSKASFLALQMGLLIPRTWKWEEDAIYILDLKRIPIMNRDIAVGFSSATALAEYFTSENQHMALLKVLRELRKRLAPEYEVTPFTQAYSDQQVTYLLSRGFREDGSFSPPTETTEVVDYYMAHTFELKYKGWSSLPSVSAVRDKAEKGGKLGGPTAVMYAALVAHEATPLEELDKQIGMCKYELGILRSYIQRAKFAVLLGHGWFDEFGSQREGCFVETESGDVVTFELGEEKVAY